MWLFLIVICAMIRIFVFVTTLCVQCFCAPLCVICVLWYVFVFCKYLCLCVHCFCDLLCVWYVASLKACFLQIFQTGWALHHLHDFRKHLNSILVWNIYFMTKQTKGLGREKRPIQCCYWPGEHYDNFSATSANIITYDEIMTFAW